MKIKASGAIKFDGKTVVKDRFYRILQSLVFDDTVPNSLTINNYAASSSALTHTFSFWIKRENAGESDELITGNTNGTNTGNYFTLASDNKLYTGRFDNGSGWLWLQSTTNTFTTTSEWLHLVLAHDSTQGTSTDRVKMYVNGVEQAVSGSYPSLNLPTWWMNSSQPMNIGYRRDGFGGNNHYFGGKMAELYFISGQQLTPSSFGEMDAGAWRPIAYTGVFGPQDTYLKFDDTSDFGKDSSGNGIDFTGSGFTAGSQDTSDTPTT